jgi:hypothetical protein
MKFENSINATKLWKVYRDLYGKGQKKEAILWYRMTSFYKFLLSYFFYKPIF